MADVNTKDTFVMYVSHYESIRSLTLEQKGLLLDCIFLYAKGEMPEVRDSVVAMAFSFIRECMSSDTAKYAAIAEKRREAGRKHRGNQYPRKMEQNGTNGTNGTNAYKMEQMEQVFQNRTNDNDNDNEPTDTAGNTKKGKSPTTRFVPPTADEVKVYCAERGNTVNAESFVDFYASKGWKVGSSPMKDWKAAVRTWEKRDGRGTQQRTKSGMTLGVGEYITQDGRRTYGSGRYTVPDDAPPRLGKDYIWSKETNSWIVE